MLALVFVVYTSIKKTVTQFANNETVSMLQIYVLLKT